MIHDLLLDLRLAFRGLRKQARFALPVVLLLATGIGASTLFFSLVHRVLLSPLSYRQPERLVQLWPEDPVNKLIVATLAERARSFDSISPYQGGLFGLNADRDPVMVRGARVGVEHFAVLQASPFLGRAFSPEEGRPGRDQVAVLGYGLWKRRFGADREIVGRSILVDGEPRTVIGVMPADFRPLESGWEIWLPLPMDPANAQDFQGSFYLSLVARLEAGATPRSAEQEVRRLVADLQAAYPNLITPEKLAAARVVPLQQYLVQTVRPILLVLLGAAGFVLLVVCGNVATLLLAHTLQRRKETAVRSALGAQRGRLVRLVAAESLILSLLGGLGGLALAAGLLRWLRARFSGELPRAGEIGIDAAVLAFTIALSILVALSFSLWPARRAFRSDLLKDLNAGPGGFFSRESHRLGQLLVAFQVAMAVILLVGAGLLLKSLWHLQTVNPGFRAEDVLTLRLDLPPARYKTPSQTAGYYQRVLEQVRDLPGVARAGAIHLLPLTSDNWNFPYLAQDHPVPPGAPSGTALPDANFRVVTPGYFESLDIRLLDGRSFSSADEAGSPPVGLINQTLAVQLWPGGTAVGKTIQHFGNGGPSFTVVGVVADVFQHRLDVPPKPEIYRPYTQWPVTSMYLVVRAKTIPTEIVPSVRAAVWKVDPEVPISELQPLQKTVSSSTVNERSTSLMVTLFAAFSLLLSLVGIYGIMSYSVRRRTREIGLRMALGAPRGLILRQVLSAGMAILVIGLGGGWLVALACTPHLASRLYRTSATDPWTYLLAGALILGSGLASSLLPAWKATRISALAALKQDTE